MSEVKRYVLRGPADCPAPDGSQIERLLPGWQVVDAAAYDALQVRVRELQELVGDLQEENTRLDRELEYAQQVTIPYLEQERNALQEYIAKQPDAEASITRLERDNAALRAELDRLHKAEQERDLWEHRSSRFESGLPSPNDD